MSEVGHRYVKHIFPVALPAAHADKQVAGMRSATEMFLATEPHIRPHRHWGFEKQTVSSKKKRKEEKGTEDIYRTDHPYNL